jgi:hypothetical protein
LEILVYCSKKKCIKLEQKYINLLKPEYNILKIAGSSLGKTQSAVTRAKISASMMGNSNSIKQAQKIEVTDLELKTKTTFGSIREAARALNISQSRITKYFSQNQKKPYIKRYAFYKALLISLNGEFTKQVSNMIKLASYQYSVVIGLLLSEKFSRSQLAMVKLSPYTRDIIFGLLLSDG